MDFDKIMFLMILGMGITVLGLICIICLSFMMISFFKRFSKVETVSAAIAPASENASYLIPNRGEFVAAISAAIAEDMGTDVSSIKILSIKRI